MLIAALAVALIVGQCHALAQVPPQIPRMPCGNHDSIIKMLGEHYKEYRVAAAIITEQAALIEVLTAASGTWTILITMPRGPTCIISAGDGWQDYEKKLPETPL